MAKTIVICVFLIFHFKNHDYCRQLFAKRKLQLCKSMEPLRAIENQSPNDPTNTPPKRKYANFAKTCVICRRQQGSNLSYFS